MSPVLSGLAEALAAAGPGFYVDQPPPDFETVDEEEARVADVCDTCNGTGIDIDCGEMTDSCCRCERCGGLGYLP